MLKIGWIDFLNTLPFCFERSGLKLPFKYELKKGYPSDINKLLYEGKIDIGLISSAEYIDNFERYFILPSISISAIKKVYSVAVFSNKHLEEIKTIYLSKASKSSRLLTKVVFDKFLQKKVEYQELENYSNIESKSVLLIGDNAILFSNKFKYIYDLSELWNKETGYPFVFALWCVRKESLKEKKEEVKLFYKTLIKAKEIIFKNLESFIQHNNIDKNFAKTYLENLDYSLTNEHIKSLELFSQYLQELGIINKKPEFNLLKF